MADDNLIDLRGHIDPLRIPTYLRSLAKTTYHGQHSQCLNDAADEIERLWKEREGLHRDLNLETAKRFAADNPPGTK